jgi:hypothetical protein
VFPIRRHFGHKVQKTGLFHTPLSRSVLFFSSPHRSHSLGNRTAIVLIGRTPPSRCHGSPRFDGIGLSTIQKSFRGLNDLETHTKSNGANEAREAK